MCVHFVIHDNFQARNCRPSIHKTFNVVTHAYRGGGRYCSPAWRRASAAPSPVPSLRTDIRAAEDWK